MTITERSERDAPQTEPGRTLADPQPRTLGFADQIGLWGNLGVSLLGPAYAYYVLVPTDQPVSLTAAFVAVVLGSVIGFVPVALAARAGAQTGSPAMVLMRGLFGTRLSYLPTVLNLLQCLGWAVFELVVIATAAEQLLLWEVRWPYVVAAGVLTTAMALRPLGVVRTLRRYAIVAVAASSVYFFVEFARHPLPSLTHGSWSGFWLAADGVIAVSISWVPLAADYTRHARSSDGAFAGSLVGYSVAQIAYYTLGLLAFSTVVAGYAGDNAPVFKAFIAVPFGWLPFAILVLRELDESFTNVYSTTVSVQNLRTLGDRRVLAVAIGPLSAVFVVDYFVLRRRHSWNTSQSAPPRWVMLVPWALGFGAYQLIHPAAVPGWDTAWAQVQSWLHFTPQTWMSASLSSFVVAAVATGLIRPARRA